MPRVFWVKLTAWCHWKQCSCCSSHGPVTSFKQALALMLLLSELLLFMKTSENQRAKKKGFFSSHFVRLISSLRRSGKWQLQWEEQWLRLLLPAAAKCPLELTWNCIFQAFCSIYWFLYIPGWLWWSLSPYSTHIYITWIFFFNPVMNVHKFSYFSLPVCL